MKTHIHATRPAGLAIAAALALTPLSLFAQEAPESVAPPADPAPAAAPPEAAAPAPDPVVEAAPIASTPEAAPVARTTTTITRTTRTVAPAPVRTAPRTAIASPAVAPVAVRTVTPAPIATEAVPSALPETTVAPLPADEPVVAPPVQQRSAFDTQMALILGGLAGLAFLGWGFYAIGRRRRPSIAVVPEPVIERPLVAEPVAATPMREPIAFAPRPAPAAAGLRHTGAAAALPKELPQSHEAREQLLNRMVDARPDRANPFTSPIQRRKRARLIMQCIGKTFDHAPRIDLSQYPENWPELQTMRYADAA